MPRESARDKGMRYLTEGRLCVLSVNGDYITARVRGESGEVYDCGHRGYADWHCSCPAKTRCAHLYALMAVTIRRETP